MHRSRDLLVRFVLLTAAGGSFVPVPRSLYGQERRCEAAHDLGPLGRTRYMLRGARCEGVIAREIGGDVIRVVGLTRGVEDFDPHAGADLRLDWDVEAADSVWLLAVALRPQLHYQMDASVPASATEFRWPVGVLDAEGLGRDDLGVRAWTARRVGAGTRALLVPVRLWQRRAPPPSDATLLIVPIVRLRVLLVTVTRLDSVGRDVRVMRDARALGTADFRAEEAVPISLPELSTPGIYRVRVAGEYYDHAGTTSTEVLVLGAGR